MKIEKARRFQQIYECVRIVLIIALLLFIGIASGSAQTMEERISILENRLSEAEQKIDAAESKNKYMPQMHGILRGKYEYQPDLDGGRFEVRNARLSANGSLPLRSEYKLEVDLCDESSIKMKDAWVRLNPWRTLRFSIGQQRLPFSIDAHRNPSAQYFANRSFIAKQVGDMRDVGFLAGYTFKSAENNKPYVIIDAGIFNGSNIDNQKTAWHSDVNYSARLQWFPVSGLALVPSIQHTAIADRKVHYTSLDFGSYYEFGGVHVEAEYLHKIYNKDAFNSCDAVNVMTVYKQKLPKAKYLQTISCLARYDYMGDHTNGKSGFVTDESGAETSKLKITDYLRHRMTLGLTLSVNNPYFPTDIRFNYEKYWYPNGGAKESEQDKLVAEIMIRF
jgi:hypothetical protein